MKKLGFVYYGHHRSLSSAVLGVVTVIYSVIQPTDRVTKGRKYLMPLADFFELRSGPNTLGDVLTVQPSFA